MKDSPPESDWTLLTLPVKLSSTSMSRAVCDLLPSSSDFLSSSNLPPDMSASLRLAHSSTLSKYLAWTNCSNWTFLDPVRRPLATSAMVVRASSSRPLPSSSDHMPFRCSQIPELFLSLSDAAASSPSTFSLAATYSSTALWNDSMSGTSRPASSPFSSADLLRQYSSSDL